MEKPITTKNFYDIMIRLAFLTLIVAWCLMILLPFFSIILWSIILAMALKPLHDSMSKKLGGRLKLTSGIIILFFVLMILIPGWLFFDSIIEGVKNLKANFDAGTLTIPPPTEDVKTWPVIGGKLYDTWFAASQNLMGFVMQYKEQLMGVGSKLLKSLLSVGSGSVQIIASFIIAGFLLVIPGVGESMRKFFRKLIGEKGDEFADMTYKTVGNVVKGILGVAFIQAVITGIGFLLAGVPFAGLWTLFVFILAVLQIPPAIVVYPIIVYLFTYLNMGMAIFWTAYLLIAGFSDNILKPILLGKGAPVPMLVIFMGVIGGFIFSGFIGLFTGAIIISIGYKLLIAWINDFEPKTENEEPTA
jgi:predicted PurR-regulated permease PerM